MPREKQAQSRWNLREMRDAGEVYTRVLTTCWKSQGFLEDQVGLYEEISSI